MLTDTVCKVEGLVYQSNIMKCLSRKQEFYRVTLTDQELCLQNIPLPHKTERYSVADLFGCQTLRHRKQQTLDSASAYICFHLYPHRQPKSESDSNRRKKILLVFEIWKENCTFEQNLEIAFAWNRSCFEIFEKNYPNWARSKSKKYDSESSIPLAYDDKEEMFNHSSHLEKYIAVPSTSSALAYFRKVLVILNPKSGQGKCIKIFEVFELKKLQRLLLFTSYTFCAMQVDLLFPFQSKVAPLFKEAGIKVHLLVTQHSGHAESTVASCNLFDLDGVVCVGGDGLLFEVVNGMRKRSDFETTCNVSTKVFRFCMQAA